MLSSRILQLPHIVKGTKSCFSDRATVSSNAKKNLPELNLKENLLTVVKRKMRDAKPNIADDLKETEVSLHFSFELKILFFD